MIFQHTLEAVLDGTKTQTSRVWKDYYRVGDNRAPFIDSYQIDGYGSFHVCWSVKSGKPRMVYAFGQSFAVQPARGKKGVARIRIKKLEKRSVLTFTDSDIQQEGFTNKMDFLSLWRKMHKDNDLALVINFALCNEYGTY